MREVLAVAADLAILVGVGFFVLMALDVLVFSPRRQAAREAKERKKDVAKRLDDARTSEALTAPVDSADAPTNPPQTLGLQERVRFEGREQLAWEAKYNAANSAWTTRDAIVQRLKCTTPEEEAEARALAQAFVCGEER